MTFLDFAGGGPYRNGQRAFLLGGHACRAEALKVLCGSEGVCGSVGGAKTALFLQGWTQGKCAITTMFWALRRARVLIKSSARTGNSRAGIILIFQGTTAAPRSSKCRARLPFCATRSAGARTMPA